MTEEDGLRIDLRRMFPEAVRRAEILERLKNSWPMIVNAPAVSRYSKPVVLGVNYLTVETCNDLAKNNLLKMKGNILRVLARLGYEPDGDFALRIDARVHDKRTVRNKPVRREIIADEGRVRQYMTGAPDTLPEDINYSLSHLKAYLELRSAIQ